jgi:Xaa-Pro aminopeptidase
MTAAPPSRPSPFERAVFEARWHRLQAAMHAARPDAILVSNLSNLRYLTGHAPLIGVAPTRPWYGILPLDGAPVVVVPELGRHDMEREGV